jgi:ATP-dependent Clp protease adaptor protein ClpS
MTDVKEDIAIDEQIKIDVQPPGLWKVILLNDDVTPMDLVIDILVSFFKHTPDSAKKITMDIHNTGSGVAGIYSHEVAEHLAIESTSYARKNGSPLKIRIEEE